MRFKKSLNIITIALLTTSFANSKKIDYENVYKSYCQVCHGRVHQGDIGADLRPHILKMKDPYRLSSSMINGVAKVMPSFISRFSKTEAIGMVDWLMSWEDKSNLTLKLEDINRYWRPLADKLSLSNKYKTPADVKSLDYISLIIEKDVSLVTFIDTMTNKVLSRHRAGYAIHATLHNKKYPRYAYSISQSGRLTMFDLMASGEPAIAYARVGEKTTTISISNDGQYIIAGNTYPAGVVILNALTLKPIKVIDTKHIPVTKVSATPYASYFIMVLKKAGLVKLIDYSKSDFPIITDIKIDGKLNGGFLNQDKGENLGRYYLVARHKKGNSGISIIDLESKKVIKNIKFGKEPSGNGISWHNNKLKTELYATVDKSIGEVTIFDSSWKIVKKIKTSDGGAFINSDIKSPYLWVDCSNGKKDTYNEIHLIDKESLKTVKIIKIGKTEGKLIDIKSKKIIQKWNAIQHLTNEEIPIKSKISKERITPYSLKLGREAKYPVEPKLLYTEPINNGKSFMISEFTTGRVGIYNAKSGEFIKYINNLATPTYIYSISKNRTH